MKETQSEDQGSKRNRREAQCHQGRGAVCPPLLGAQSLQQSLAQTRGWRQWEEGNGGVNFKMERGGDAVAGKGLILR